LGIEKKQMQTKYQDIQAFLRDFLALVIELECGRHYDPTNNQHVEWLPRRVGALYALGGKAICLYLDDGSPVGFIFVIHDPGLEQASCFGKKATIAMFGLTPEFRGKGMGSLLLREAENFVRQSGGECLYVDTYADNTDAIRYYAREGFIPIAYHPGENGLEDKGQVYLMKELKD
jgi:ribosomal protein S18 acetylase RimI-like enzyme